MPTVDILLATYQNARYLPALMDSLAAQTRRDFRLLVSDDCSNDGSADIVESYADRFDRFELIRRASPSGSAKANFSFLLERADADYVLFADADDVWDHDKVERTLAMLESGNAQFGSGTPHYVFSDVRLIDGNGGPKGASYWAYKKMHPGAGDPPARALVCPPMLGCASGINRALHRLAMPVPVDEVTGHDWYLLLLAAFAGKVSVLDDTTMSYRLHGANSSDQKPVSMMKYAGSSGKLDRVRAGMTWRRRQAAAVLAQLDGTIDEQGRALIEAFVSLPKRGALTRRWTLLANRILYPDLPRNLAMFAGA